MSLTEQQSRSFGAFFVGAYLLAGLYAASFVVGVFDIGLEPQLGIGNTMVYLVLAAPLMLAIGSATMFARKRHFNPFLWASAALWLIVSISELVETSRIVPNEIVVVLMLVVSAACVAYLVMERRRAP